MVAYRCLNCGCVHGWEKHRLIVKAAQPIRNAWEDIWYCPQCGIQHRSTDGTLLGQINKRWKQLEDFEEVKRDYQAHYYRQTGQRIELDDDGSIVSITFHSGGW